MSNEKRQMLIEAGYTDREIEQLINALAYRAAYNARPEVKAKRALYNKLRNDRLAKMKTLLR